MKQGLSCRPQHAAHRLDPDKPGARDHRYGLLDDPECVRAPKPGKLLD